MSVLVVEVVSDSTRQMVEHFVNPDEAAVDTRFLFKNEPQLFTRLKKKKPSVPIFLLKPLYNLMN